MKVLLFSLILSSLPVAAATQGELCSNTQIPISIEGKQVGSMRLKAGSGVTILKLLPNDGVLISRGEGEPVTIAKSALTQKSLQTFQGATPNPNQISTPTPTLVATPTPTPSPSPSVMEKKVGYSMTEVACDDPQETTHTHTTAPLANIMSGVIANRVFTSPATFVYTNINTNANYKVDIRFPMGRGHNEDPCTRHQSVSVNGTVLLDTKFSSEGGSAGQIEIPKTLLTSNRLEIRMDALAGYTVNAHDLVVGKVTITSNDSTPLKGEEQKKEEVASTKLDGLFELSPERNLEFIKGHECDGNINGNTRYSLDPPSTFLGLDANYGEVTFNDKNQLVYAYVLITDQSRFDDTIVQGSTKDLLEMNKAAAWKAIIDKNEVALKTALETKFGKGTDIKLDANTTMETPATQYVSDKLCIRVKHDRMYEEVTIEPTKAAENLSIRKLDWTTASAREAMKKSVTVLSNGDHKINLFAFSQKSSPYCAIATSSMVADQFGLNLDVFEHAARSNYNLIGTRDFTHNQHNNGDVYGAIASLTNRKLHVRETPDFYKIKSLIDEGAPIIIYRFFAYKRMEKQTALAKKDPLDPPETLDRTDWVNGDVKTKTHGGGDYHASIITGYNAERNEVLVSESWGANTINSERIRVEEILYSTACFFWWSRY